MKKIGIIVLDFTLKGGIERFVSNFTKILSDEDLNVTVYSMHKTNPEPLYDVPNNVSIIYITSIKFIPFFYKFSSFYACLKLIYLQRKSRSTLKYFSTSPILTIYFSLLSSSFAKLIIASEHSSYMAHSYLIRKLRIYCYSSISSIFTQTKDGVSRFKNDGLDATCIPNSVTEFGDARQWVCSKNKIDNEFIIITVARFEAVKQLEHFVEVAFMIHSISPKIVFKIIGSGPGEFALRELIFKYELKNVVEIVPATSQINDYYAAASAYIITSYSEAFPMTMLEALSYGVPVFSYNELIGPAEVIIDGFNGYLCRQNEPRSIADKLITVINDSDLLNNLRVNCINSALKYSAFEIKPVIKRLL
jgi:glycosyltransferase involved in cell wall biosynthesis